MKITISSYPETFSFQYQGTFPRFKRFERCDKRQEVLLKMMNELHVDSRCHAYEDYVIESININQYGETWHLGS